MDLRRLRTGEWLTSLAGVVLLVSLFLPWYGADLGSLAQVTATGYESMSVIDIVLTFIALAAIAVVPVTAAWPAPTLPLAHQSLLLLFGLVGFVLALIRLVDVPFDGAALRAGAWLGFAASVGVVVAVLIAMRDERLSKPGHPTDATGVPLTREPAIETLPAPQA